MIASMRLLIKFSAIFTLVFGVGVAIIGALTYKMLQDGARAQVLGQAQLMMQAMSSVRKYTTVQLLPLLEPEEDRTHTFLPQTVPGYAATENFTYLRAQFPEYSYKEATLNPTNPRDRAVEWEADIVNSFRNDPNLKTFNGERDAATGKSLYFAQPIRAGAACLHCHSTPDVAPAPMIARYGSANGFGWKENEVIAAQIISLPLSVPLEIAHSEFRTVLIYLGIVFLGSLAVLNTVIYFTIAKPASSLSDMANKISLGDLEVPELPVKGKDEIADLAGAFNRMRRSLVHAMRMLGDQDK
jgi:protein-histidine pros-kinase